MSAMMDVLQAEMKAEGLELAEETAKLALKAIMRALPKVVEASENKYYEMLIPILAVVEPQIMKLIEDINKADNEPEVAE